MSDINPQEFEINLLGVRISYPHLFEPYKGTQKDSKPKYSARFLLSKEAHSDLVKQIAKKMKELTAATPSFKGKLPTPDMLCLRDGDVYGKGEEEEGHWTLNASENTRPIVVDRDRSPLTAEDDKIYPGCVVNAKIRLWAQDNAWGKRINANLLGVQFVKDGDRLGNGVPRQTADEMFDAFEGDDGAFDGDDNDPFA